MSHSKVGVFLTLESSFCEQTDLALSQIRITLLVFRSGWSSWCCQWPPDPNTYTTSMYVCRVGLGVYIYIYLYICMYMYISPNWHFASYSTWMRLGCLSATEAGIFPCGAVQILATRSIYPSIRPARDFRTPGLPIRPPSSLEVIVSAIRVVFVGFVFPPFIPPFSFFISIFFCLSVFCSFWLCTLFVVPGQALFVLRSTAWIFM